MLFRSIAFFEIKIPSEQAPDTDALPGRKLNQKIDQATNQHGGHAEIKKYQQPARGSDARLIDIVPEDGLRFIAFE